MVFIYLEKACGEVPTEMLWRCLEKKVGLAAYIRVIRDIEEGVRRRVRTSGGKQMTSQ